MLEEGVVIGHEGEYSLVEKERSSACGGCSHRGGCGTSESGDKVVLKVFNNVGASMGDRVRFSFDSTLVMRSAFFVYIFPVLMLIGGSGFGSLISKVLLPSFGREFFPVLFGLLFFFLSFFFVRRYNKWIEKDRESKPVIVKIL